MRKNVLVSFGTRPEAIKMAPVIKALRETDFLDVKVVNTGQHLELIKPALELFGIAPDYDLGTMRQGDSLASLTARLLESGAELLETLQPDYCLVHGDTSSTFAIALASFYNKAKILHVEAGLRSHDLANPFPEEMSRRFVSLVAHHHFAPTELAMRNLMAEGASEQTITVTGNTVVDAIRLAREKLNSWRCRDDIQIAVTRAKELRKPLVLATCHRRENMGPGIESVCEALANLARSCDVQILFVLHMNPSARNTAIRMLSGVASIALVEPMNYMDTLCVMQASRIIITDSGGLQEEAPAFGVPVLVLRSVTERPEGVTAGVARLVGTDSTKILDEAHELLDGRTWKGRVTNPYGDGYASQRIVDYIIKGP